MTEIPARTAPGAESLVSVTAAEDLTVTPEGPSQLLTAGWQPLVLEALAATHGDDERTFKKLVRNVAWLFSFLVLCGTTQWSEITPEVVLRWCWAGVRRPDGTWADASVSTARNRQWVAMTVFAIAAGLGAHIDPQTAAGPRIQREPPAKRAGPVADSVLRQIRSNADRGGRPTQRSVAVAMFSSGATATETGDVRRSDVDLEAKTVRFRGPNARVCALDDWSVRAIRRYLRAHPDTAPDDRLCVAATTAPQHAAQTVSTQLCAVINQAGFADRPDISARSIRLTAAHKILILGREHGGGIEAAARFLGSPSLDNTAQALGYDWQHEPVAEPLGRGRRSVGDPDPDLDVGDRDG